MGEPPGVSRRVKASARAACARRFEDLTRRLTPGGWPSPRYALRVPAGGGRQPGPGPGRRRGRPDPPGRVPAPPGRGGRPAPQEFDLHSAELLDGLDPELRKIAVLRLLGHTNREVAAALGWTERKVE